MYGLTKCLVEPELIIWEHTHLSREKEIWIIGGAKTYQRYAHLIDEWHVSRITNFNGKADTYFDENLLTANPETVIFNYEFTCKE